jgi:REP-associated tyrosine transposase
MDKKNKIYYKRFLPHYQPSGYTFFVTYRLNDTLPMKVIKQLKEERERLIKQIAAFDNPKTREEKYKNFQSRYFGKVDRLLDRVEYGPKWLKNKEAARVVKDAMHYYDNKVYNLICYTIMSNHVHQVFTPIVTRVSDSTKKKNTRSGYRTVNTTINFAEKDRGTSRNRVSSYKVSEILQNLKRYTAVECNKLVHHSGSFWQHESYDHVVRNNGELNRIVKYVLYNPVKAGLCERWDDWEWSYVNFDLMG